MISTLRVEVVAHHLQRVLELHEAAQRQVLGLHRHDHPVAATNALIVSSPSDGGVSIST